MVPQSVKALLVFQLAIETKHVGQTAALWLERPELVVQLRVRWFVGVVAECQLGSHGWDGQSDRFQSLVWLEQNQKIVDAQVAHRNHVDPAAVAVQRLGKLRETLEAHSPMEKVEAARSF